MDIDQDGPIHMISDLDQKLLKDFFTNNKNTFKINGSDYTNFQGFVVIKKIIIYLIMILDNLNLFVKIKTDSKIVVDSLINPAISKKNEIIIQQKIDDKKKYKNVCFEFDKSLLNLSIRDLVKKIKIKDILQFLKISQLNFLIKNPKFEKFSNGCRTKTIYLKKPVKNNFDSECMSIISNKDSTLSQKKEKLIVPNVTRSLNEKNSINNNPISSKSINIFGESEKSSHEDNSKVNLNIENSDNWIQFTMREYEIDEIILAKRKRPDEELKHSFKAVRKGIDKIFKEKEEVDSDSEKPEKFVKKDVSLEIFEMKPGLAKKYKNPNITKEVVANLKKCKKFVKCMNEYIGNFFLKEEIANNVINKQEEIMKKNLTLKEFLLALMTKQKKNGWIVQNILNSLDVLENCTEQTILKKKGKKRVNIDIKSTKKKERKKKKEKDKSKQKKNDSNDIYISSK